MAFLLPADPTQPTRDVEPENGTDFKLSQLYVLLDCSSIEVLDLPSGRIMIIDGEGKMAARPVRNARATQLAHFVSPKEFIAQMLQIRNAGVEAILAGPSINDLSNESDFIAGNALICEDDELR